MASDGVSNALKPMNCPCHVQVYNQGLTSYKDLPIRFSEFGSCHRYEASGTMHGLMRVRGFTQDDGHIFCTEDQIEDETKSFITLLSDIYKTLGFNKFNIKLSTRPEVRIGNDETWDKAENALQKAIERLDLPYVIEEGEGAFYGPKLDFVLTDAIGRQWQCGTFQADFILPSRLDAVYVGEDGKKHNPVMIHRAPFGSMERFVAILIEHTAGVFPLWLTTIQVEILIVGENFKNYGQKVLNILENHEIRAHLDDRNETVGKKIRESEMKKIPFMIVVGENEVKNNSVSIRRHHGDDLGEMKIEEFVDIVKKEISECIPKFNIN